MLLRGATLASLFLSLVAASACGESGQDLDDFAWGRSAGGTGDDVAYAVATGPNDAILVTGTFEETITFGAGDVTEVLLAALDGKEMFVAKYDRDGGLVWARFAGGAGHDVGRGVAVAADGSVFVTGSIQGYATFGQGEANETTLFSMGSDDGFLAKYSSHGELAWARLMGGIDDDISRDVQTMPDGGAVVTGEFQRTAYFDGAQPNSSPLDYYASTDIFLARYDAAGNLSWARRAGGMGINRGNAIDVAENGAILVTGEFRQQATFGEGESLQTRLFSYGGADMFVAKFGQDGSLHWARKAGSVQEELADDIGWDVAAAPDGGVFVTGEYGETATFGGGESLQTTLVATGLDCAFLAKYDYYGFLEWVRDSSGTFTDEGTGVAALPNGGAVITGRFHRNTILGKGTPSETHLVSEGPYDIFAAEYNAVGELTWAERAGGYSADDIGYGVATTSDGGVIIGGTFADRAIFGERTPYCPYVSSAGKRDIFVARVTP